MKNTTQILGILISTIVLFACSDETKSDYVLRLEDNHENLMKNEIDSIFPSGYHFYVPQEMNLAKTIDLITTMNTILAKKDSIIVKQLNEKVVTWLTDSIFILPSKRYKGVFQMDTTNLLLLTDELTYYRDSSIQHTFNFDDRLLYYNDATSFKTTVGEYTFYFDIVPVKKKFLGIEGKYVLHSTNDYVFYGPEHKRFLCEKYLVDWYLTVSSELFSTKEMALKFSDTTLHFSSSLLR